MARIPGVPAHRAGLFVRMSYRVARRKLGKLPESVEVAAHAPWMLAAMGGFEMAQERSRHVPEVLKCLADIRAATLVGCPF